MNRLQKVIAQAGITSRRKAEQLILDGQVKVNGVTITELGVQVSSQDVVEVNGKVLERQESVIYVFYKPKGCVSTVRDDKGRKSIIDFFPKDVRLYPVGRLDYDTSGILLVTNDGNFTHHMTHPKFHIPKTYLVNVQGILTRQDQEKITKGFAEFSAGQVKLISIDRERQRCIIELTIYEGQNHEVKRMMEALGHSVRKLHRKSFGGIELGLLKPGQYRLIKPHELKQLKRMASL